MSFHDQLCNYVRAFDAFSVWWLYDRRQESCLQMLVRDLPLVVKISPLKSDDVLLIASKIIASAYVIDLVSCQPLNIPTMLSCIAILKSGQFTTNQGQIVDMRPPPQIIVIATFVPHTSQLPRGVYWNFQDLAANSDFFKVPKVVGGATTAARQSEIPHESMDDEEFLTWVHKAWRTPDFAFYDKHQAQIKARFHSLAGPQAICLNIQ